MTATEIQLHEATFTAFGSHCRVACDIESTVFASVHRLEDLESRWSRFRPDSEITRVNNAQRNRAPASDVGEWIEVSAITGELVARAELARERTGGRVNSLMLNQLSGLGYDRSHDLLELTTEPTCTHDRRGQPATREQIEIEGSSIRLPKGSAFDPGGIGKGLAADLVLEDMLDAGAHWAMVSLGGDIRFGGDELLAQGLTVHIDDPRNKAGLLGATRVHGGALATSSTTARRWNQDTSVHHHLLDPATGLPTLSPRRAATVFAQNAWWADVVAKSVIVDPSIDADLLRTWECEAVVFTDDTILDLGLNYEAASQ
jgi:thiamine biosynthesis lipoprotein